jgi:hypothetical protein
MNSYSFLRLAAVPLAMIGWAAYQLFIKKKRFKDFQGDLYAVLFMVAVYSALIYFFIF